MLLSNHVYKSFYLNQIHKFIISYENVYKNIYGIGELTIYQFNWTIIYVYIILYTLTHVKLSSWSTFLHWIILLIFIFCWGFFYAENWNQNEWSFSFTLTSISAYNSEKNKYNQKNTLHYTTQHTYFHECIHKYCLFYRQHTTDSQ